jgi:soluble lytic murein transglycosylase-like protein
VLEIDGDGGVIVHDRPEVTLASGVTAISLPRNARGAEAGSARGDRAALSEAAARSALSPDLLEAVAWRESGLQPRAVSPAGAVGEMQLMPATARDLGVDPYDARQNIAGGAAYLSGLLKRYDGDMIRALAAYNAGPRAVDRYGGVPPYKETQDYVAAILERLSRRATVGSEGR